jgi:4-amino-4-deoxy-L-arabinose transferase-like glycosyltransferase
MPVDKPRDIPLPGLILGSLAVVPPLAGAVAAWAFDANWIVHVTIMWGAALLAFFGGVRRGLSFQLPDRAKLTDLSVMLWLFFLALAALISPWSLLSSIALIVGFISVGVVDPKAAERGRAPPFFSRFRPAQMVFPILGYAAITVHTIVYS